MGFFLTALAVIIGSLLVGAMIVFAAIRFLLGTSGSASPGWLTRITNNRRLTGNLPWLIGLAIFFLFWTPIANYLAPWIADSDMGRTFGLDPDTVRGLLWVPFILVALGALVALIGSKQMGTFLGGTFTVVSIGVIAALFISGIYEERGNGCGGLSELASGPGDIVEINTFTVLTVTVCRGDPRVTLLMENDLPPMITFAGDQAQIDALTRQGIQPSWFAVAQNVPGRMDLYWFNTLNSGFDATQSDRITLIISSM
jgi:hypothetical protein